VQLQDGGTVDNGQSGSTAGLILAGGTYSTAVLITGAAGTVVNYGTIAGSAPHYGGVVLQDGGTVANAGEIFGNVGAVEIDNAVGSVINSGVVSDTGSGYRDTVQFAFGASGAVTNTGTITAVAGTRKGGIAFSGAGTVLNGVGGAAGASVTAS
jgi:hypothetical protein